MNNISVYSKDNRGIYMSVNEGLLQAAMACSASDVIGVCDKDLSWGKTAGSMMQNDAHIIKTGKINTFFEHSMLMGKQHVFRSFKAPIVGRNGTIIGVQGISIPVSDRCLIPLTEQQTACLKYLALGNTHKQIGNSLGLSPKTVEHYLEAVKLKLNCFSRDELIRQAIERGLASVF